MEKVGGERRGERDDGSRWIFVFFLISIKIGERRFLSLRLAKLLVGDVTVLVLPAVCHDGGDHVTVPILLKMTTVYTSLLMRQIV